MMQLELQTWMCVACERKQLAKAIRFGIGDSSNAQEAGDITLHLLCGPFQVVGSTQHLTRQLKQLAASCGQLHSA